MYRIFSLKNKKNSIGTSALFCLITVGMIEVLRIGVAKADLGPEVLKKFEELRGVLKTDFNAPTICGIKLENGKSLCEFASACKVLEANKNRLFLYVNGRGEKVPNYSLIAEEEKLKNCFAKLQKKQEFAQDPQKKLKQKMQEAYQLKKEMQKSIRDHHEQATEEAIKEALLDIKIDKFSSDKPISYAPKEEDLEKLMLNAEKRAGKKYSEKTRSLWFRYLKKKKLAEEEVRWDPINSDPLVSLEKIYNTSAAGSKDKLKENQKIYHEAAINAEKIFKESQEGIIQFLKSRTNKNNEKHIASMIKRIQTIRYSPLKVSPDTAELSPYTGPGICIAPNAFYSPVKHAFILCPQIMGLPKTALKEIISHELAHSIDPCIASGNLYETDPTIAVEGSDYLKNYKESVKANQRPGIEPYKAKLDDGIKSKYTVDIFDLGATTINRKNYMERQSTGLSPRHVKESVVAEAIPLSESPFANVLSCLKSDQSAGVRVPLLEDAMGNINSEIDIRRRSGASSEDVEFKKLLQQKEKLPELFSKKGACSFINGGKGESQLNEGFADWIAAAVIGQDIEKAQSKSQKDQISFEAISTFLSLGCKSLSSDRKDEMKQKRIELGCESEDNGILENLEAMNQIKSVQEDSHSRESTRVERIFLANPKISKAIGCTDFLMKGKVISCE